MYCESLAVFRLTLSEKKIVTPRKQYASFPLMTLICSDLPNLVSRAFPTEKLGRAGHDDTTL